MYCAFCIQYIHSNYTATAVFGKKGNVLQLGAISGILLISHKVLRREVHTVSVDRETIRCCSIRNNCVY